MATSPFLFLKYRDDGDDLLTARGDEFTPAIRQADESLGKAFTRGG